MALILVGNECFGPFPSRYVGEKKAEALLLRRDQRLTGKKDPGTVVYENGYLRSILKGYEVTVVSCESVLMKPASGLNRALSRGRKKSLKNI